MALTALPPADHCPGPVHPDSGAVAALAPSRCYGGWFQHMLHQTYPDSLRIIHDDYNSPEGYIRIIWENSEERRRPALPSGLCSLSEE
jgi:hypothetical protein